MTTQHHKYHSLLKPNQLNKKKLKNKVKRREIDQKEGEMLKAEIQRDKRLKRSNLLKRRRIKARKSDRARRHYLSRI